MEFWELFFNYILFQKAYCVTVFKNWKLAHRANHIVTLNILKLVARKYYSVCVGGCVYSIVGKS